MTDVIPAYPYFPDSAVGRPVANGFVYVGVPDEDPEIVANQYSVSLILEDGSTVPVVQPLRTNAGGIIDQNGSPARVTITEPQYSLKVLNSAQDQVYYSPNSQDPESSIEISALPEMTSITGDTIIHSKNTLNQDVKFKAQLILDASTPTSTGTLTTFEDNDLIGVIDGSDNNKLKGISEQNFFSRQKTTLNANDRIAIIDVDDDNKIKSAPQSLFTNNGILVPVLQPVAASMAFSAADNWEDSPVLPNGEADKWHLIKITLPGGGDTVDVYAINAGVDGTVNPDEGNRVASGNDRGARTIVTVPILLDDLRRFRLRTTSTSRTLQITVLGVYE